MQYTAFLSKSRIEVKKPREFFCQKCLGLVWRSFSLEKLLALRGKLLLLTVCYRALEDNSGVLSKARIRQLQSTQRFWIYS